MYSPFSVSGWGSESAGAFSYNIPYGLHGNINRSYFVGTPFKLAPYKLGVRQIFLIFYLMLKSRPKIIRNGSYLNFGVTAAGFFIIQPQKNMIASVTVRFWIFTIIFFFCNLNRRLLFYPIARTVTVPVYASALIFLKHRAGSRA